MGGALTLGVGRQPAPAAQPQPHCKRPHLCGSEAGLVFTCILSVLVLTHVEAPWGAHPSPRPHCCSQRGACGAQLRCWSREEADPTPGLAQLSWVTATKPLKPRVSHPCPGSSALPPAPRGAVAPRGLCVSLRQPAAGTAPLPLELAGTFKIMIPGEKYVSFP